MATTVRPASDDADDPARPPSRPPDDLGFASATRLVQLLRDGELSSRDLLEHYLARIGTHDDAVNAVVTVDAERARREADAADAAIAAGSPVGPLHGLPMTVKDQFATAGLRTTAGDPAQQHAVPAHDALPVAKLRAAGAIVFAKTNLALHGMDVQTYNPWFGTTNNPWDLDRSPGGSSGGSAAALAAGLTALELGGDIAGSVRLPAHYCGVYSHKPTYGIIADPPPRSNPAGFRTELDIATPGPLARSAPDLELALDVLAGPSPADAAAWRLELPGARPQRLSDYRVAAWLDDPACATDPAVAGPLERMVRLLRERGVSVDETARPAFRLDDAFRDFQRLLYGTITHGLPLGRLLPFVQPLLRGDRQLSRVGRYGGASHRDWLLANEAREDYRHSWADFFTSYDVLLCPVSPVTAIPHDHSFGQAIVLRSMPGSDGSRRPYTDQLVWAGAVGLAYLPATVAPVGLSAAGLPVGVQIVGPHLEDRTTIGFAGHLAEVIGGFTAPPALT